MGDQLRNPQFDEEPGDLKYRKPGSLVEYKICNLEIFESATLKERNQTRHT